MNYRIGFLISSVFIVLLFLNSTLFVVDQRQYAVIYSFGKAQIQSVITEPGLHFKLPSPIQTVDFFDNRLRTMDSSGTDIIQTIEKQNIIIDWFVRWRVTSPAEFIRNVGPDETARQARLIQVVRNAFQEEINRETVRDLLSEKREELMNGVLNLVSSSVDGSKGKPWGIEIIDVRVTRMDFPKDITDSVYRRMEAERKRVANELRATGLADGEKIRAEADKEREIIIAQAYREAQKVKGQGDAEATEIYANSYGKDPKFAAFLRSLDAYKASFNSKSDILVVDPQNSDFFHSMRTPDTDTGSDTPNQ